MRAFEPNPELAHAHAMRRHHRAGAIYLWVIGPTYAIWFTGWLVLPARSASDVFICFQMVLPIGMGLLAISRSRLLTERARLAKTDGMWCAACWYPTDVRSGEFTCSECGARWDTKDIRRYLEPPIEHKRPPQPITEGEPVSGYRWLALPNRREENLDPERLRRTKRRLIIGLIIWVPATLLTFASTAAINWGDTDAMRRSLVVLFVPIFFAVFLLARAFNGWIRDRNWYAHLHDHLRCPKCYGPVEPCSETAVTCPACGTTYLTRKLRLHFQRKDGASVSAIHPHDDVPPKPPR